MKKKKGKSRLNELLSVEDTDARLQAMTQYAKELRINVAKVSTINGKLDEDELTVYIYDAEQNKIRARNSILALITAGGILLVLMAAVIFVFSLAMSGGG